MAGTSLYREIDALSGIPADEFDRGYTHAIGLVLAILEKHGHSEFVDPASDLLSALKEIDRQISHGMLGDWSIALRSIRTTARAAIARALNEPAGEREGAK